MAHHAHHLNDLESVLTEEQAALKSGEIRKLVELDVRKSSLLATLAETAIDDVETVNKLREIATKNHALMEAAHMGVKAARERFEALVAAQEPMKLYGPDGQKSTLTSVPRSSVERRK